MAHSIIKNNNQIFLKLYGNVNANDAMESNLSQIFNENYAKLTLDITEVSCYNEFVVGFKELFRQYNSEFHNVVIKENTSENQIQQQLQQKLF